MFEYGIICEIFEKESDHDADIVRVKARGRQRFKVLGPMKELRDYLRLILFVDFLSSFFYYELIFILYVLALSPRT